MLIRRVMVMKEPTLTWIREASFWVNELRNTNVEQAGVL